MSAHRPLSSSFWGIPHKILHINHKNKLLRGLWVLLIRPRLWKYYMRLQEAFGLWVSDNGT